MFEEIKRSDDCQTVDPINSLMISQSLQTNSFRCFPYSYSQMPAVMRPRFGHHLSGGIGPMYRLPYDYNLNAPNFNPTVPSVAIKSDAFKSLLKKHFICRICSAFSSSDVQEFKDHINVHSSPIRPFVCQICSKIFHYRCLWRNHIIIHMTVKRPVSSEECYKCCEAEPKEDKQREENRHKCEKCDSIFKSKSDWEHHSRRDCYIRPLKCPDCDYETYIPTKLKRHEATHTRDRSYACVECNSTFSQTGSLKGHLIKVHKIFAFLVSCGYCEGFEVKNFGLLKTHIERVHENTSMAYKLIKL